MKDPHRTLLEQLDRLDGPRDDELERLRARLAPARHRHPALVAGQLLQGLDDPDAAALARLRARRPRPARRWPVPAAAALAAAALAAVWLFTPTSPPAEPPPAPRVAVAWDGTPAPQAPVEGITVEPAGRGSLVAEGGRVDVTWESGRLTLDVDPARELEVEVVTREAVVRVLGTAFAVERDALGTRVTVERGRVAVACAEGEHELEAGGDLTCLPTTPSGLLGRALALDGDPEALLATVDLGLARVEAGSAVHGELLALRAEALASQGRTDDARAAAKTYLDAGHTARREDLAPLLATP